MSIACIEVENGKTEFASLAANEPCRRFDVQVPPHVIHGSSDGPVLLVQAGVSGLEIEPAMILPSLVRGIDPEEVSGTLMQALEGRFDSCLSPLVAAYPAVQFDRGRSYRRGNCSSR